MPKKSRKNCLQSKPSCISEILTLSGRRTLSRWDDESDVGKEVGRFSSVGKMRGKRAAGRVLMRSMRRFTTTNSREMAGVCSIGELQWKQLVKLVACNQQKN
jgi:hypothetical protein